ncbi:sterol desaturase family protein [Crocinitomicaceae bacterium CZZ-1]|uniref:Sterol desaturase family protein n=1 Tax=Taishania pollutisoli TaxID=2766479 RepID=A0A8J6PJB5_9FLAO|nr:sterol desaturase family protein [Taishania pollutisoli]MBC9812689.1 sterol desaturase family protein [Taishania pollutisoli]MBX2949155.1 sterol desaturase family protein [Crocinitomicaceae bacterium]NGF75913.1 fatty acid hydroxylase [Fluviicola sp. SGL-29]
MGKIEVNVYPDSDSPKLFKNKFLEFLTKTHPLVIDAMYLTIAYFLISHFYVNHSQSVLFIVGLFFAGFFSWSFAEYLMHRFLYHKIEDATYNTGIQYLFHGIHHEYPNDKTRLVLPIIPSFVIASVFFAIFYLIMGKYAFVFGPGFMIGYCAYMTVHYTVHKVAPPKRFNFWWTFHNIHHYQQHDRAFGVTSPLWDIVFGTMPEKNRKTVDVKLKKE